MPSDYQVVGRDRCHGAWEIMTILENVAKPGASACGWAWDKSANRRPDEIVFMDDSRLIRGLATFTRNREDVAAVYRTSRMASSGWFGFIRGVSPILPVPTPCSATASRFVRLPALPNFPAPIMPYSETVNGSSIPKGPEPGIRTTACCNSGSWVTCRSPATGMVAA